MISEPVAVMFALLIAWGAVTLIGHASWVLLRAFFRALSSPGTADHALGRAQRSPRADVQAMHRVLDRLVDQQLIEPSLWGELRAKTDQLAARESTAAALADSGNAASTTPADAAGSQPQDAAAWEAPRSASPGEPVVAQLADPDVSAVPPSDRHEPAAAVSGPPAAEETPVEPALSRSEIIHSFLAAHNIRWGELVAGLLIIVCSIGLVISLWNTLVQTHRVLPSLIFLGGNAAIFAAGLYTLSRWRLRHTSRAVLVIATLLVPLSILAGLAATGNVAESVRLSDPVTWLALMAGGSVYVGVLWRAGTALVGRSSARAFLLAVAGPAAILPLAPASLRLWGDQLGWLVGAGAVPLAAAWLFDARLGRRGRTSMGPAASRNRMLTLGVGSFALASLIGYLVWLLGGGRLNTTLPVAIASLPAWIAAAASAREIAARARSGTHAMVGSVIVALAIAASASVLPAATADDGWLWWWGGVLTISGLVAAVLMKRPTWLSMSTLPLGIAATLTSGVWLGDSVWQGVPLWRRVLGGESMLAVLMIGAAAAAMSRLARERDSRWWMERTAAGWFGLGLAIAAALSLTPIDWLGIAPGWSVTAVLLAGAALASAGSLRWPRVWIGSTVLTALVGVSVVRPVTVSDSLAWQSPAHWMLLLLSIAAALLAKCAVAARLTRAASIDRKMLRTSTEQWNRVSVWFTCVGATVAAIFIARGWASSACALAGASVLCLIASLRPRCEDRVRVAQVLSLFAVAAVGYGEYSGWLFARSALFGGVAPWSWALLLAATAGIWFTVREFSGTGRLTLRIPALNFLNRRSAAPSHLIDGPATAGAAALVLAGAAFSFLATLARAGGEGAFSFAPHLGWTAPLVGLLAAATVAAWLRRHEFGRALSDRLSALVFVSAIVWGSVRAAALLATDPAVELMVATSLIMAGCCAGWWSAVMARRQRQVATEAVWGAAVACAIASASGVLLFDGWIGPLLEGAAVHTGPAWVSAGWWLACAAVLLFGAMTNRSASLANLSAWLMPAAVVLVVPWFGAEHPVAWIQSASLAALAWAAICRWSAGAERRETVSGAVTGSHGFATLIGLGSAALAIAAILFDIPRLSPVFGFAGAAASAAVLGLWLAGRLRWPPGPHTTTSSLLPWPIAISLFAGHLAWLAAAWDWIAAGQMPFVLAAIWCVTAIASVVRHGRQASAGDFWHAAVTSVLSMSLAWTIGTQNAWLSAWLGSASAVAAGVLVGLVGRTGATGQVRLIAARLLGWFVLVAGAYFCSAALLVPQQEAAVWTVVLGWFSAWVVAWRLLGPDREALSTAVRRAIPDTEASWLLWIAVLGELVVTVTAGRSLGQLGHPLDPLAWLRILMLVTVSVSTAARMSRRFVWQPAVGIMLALASVVAVRISIGIGASGPARLTAASVAAGFALALLTHQLSAVHAVAVRLGRSLGCASKLALMALARSVCQVALILVAAAVAVVIGMIAAAADPPAVRLAIVTVALAGWAMAELSERTRSLSLRHTAVTIGLMAMGLWASVPSGTAVDPWLAGSMRWLVLSVLIIPTVWLMLPRLLGERLAERWQPALRQAAVVAASAAAGSLVVMLMMELRLRSSEGIPGIAPSLVVGVAVTLALLSGWAALAAILSGPGWQRYTLNLSDRGRQALIIAAQVLGLLTWLHIFLCRPAWSAVGLRSYWPYLVMALAFVSAGATEWARRRGDGVLAKTLRQTAMYLPLVPVIGFWLTATPLVADWWFSGGQVPYALLLAIGAAYYLAVSALWPGVTPRVGAAVLGNAALWVVLVQTPGWSFLGHPQAWMIPPAACVLVIAHLYRHRLRPSTASAIRYAGALVIYVSSTADMLIADIGSNLMGPVILITLALAGMVTGVVLRIRPFLYVGAMFVFVAVTSMVWHAQRAIDQSWPWWVFGITTGIGLLAGLMAIEKNKLQLQRLAESLRGWEP